jgi:hypothetical protein
MTTPAGDKIYLELLAKIDYDIKWYESETSRNAIAYAQFQKEEDRMMFKIYEAKLEAAEKMKYYLTSVGGPLRRLDLPGDMK